MYGLLNCVTKDDLQGVLTRLVACLSVMVEFLVLLDVLAATNIRISRFFFVATINQPRNMWPPPNFNI